MPAMTIRCCGMWAILFVTAAWLPAAERAIPKPLAAHPGNVFLAGEEVVMELPGTTEASWLLVDYDGRTVAEGKGSGRVNLGRLSVGYYELRGEGQPQPVFLGVLEPLKIATPKTSPVCLDVSTAWFYSEEKVPAVASLCALAGVNWVRDRLSWPDVEPKRGELLEKTKYDATARIESEAGLQVLQVNHHTPAWAAAKRDRFPTDLRDIYQFYRVMASRWQGQVQAFEPWNEADWVMFGGHSGSEMASLQKACYWGLKAGNPDVIVCQNVFANYFPRIIADFHANRAWPYFDTLNFHHYWALDGLPKYYGQFREISGGRPMWVSECNLPVEWSGDEKQREPAEADLRAQVRRLWQIFAISIHGGSSATYWFIFPNYAEGKQQFGVVHSDLTPRPAYLALAAAGRLLCDARPLGMLKAPGKNLTGYLFRARPDGKEQIVLVAWAAKDAEQLALPIAPSAVLDAIGRNRPSTGVSPEVTASPIVAVFPNDVLSRFDYEPAPKLPAMAEGKPSTVVLQAIWPEEKSTHPKVDWLQSCYHVSSDAPQGMPIYLYNFGAHDAKGRLAVKGPKDWKLTLPPEASIAPMGRLELSLQIDLRDTAWPALGQVQIEGDFGEAGQTCLSLRLLPELKPEPKTLRELKDALAADRWKGSAPKEYRIAYKATPDGLLVEIDKGQAKEQWCALALELAPEERPGQGEIALLLPIETLEGEAKLAVEFVEEQGASFSVPYAQAGIALGHALTPSWSNDAERTVRPDAIRSIRVRCDEMKGERLRLRLKKASWMQY